MRFPGPKIGTWGTQHGTKSTIFYSGKIKDKTLANRAGVLGRPIDEDGLSVDQIAAYGAKVAAVGRDGAVIAHHEVVAGRHSELWQ